MRGRTGFPYYFIAVTAIVVRICAQSGYPIETIEFGGSGYPRDALLSATGLRTGMPFGEAVLQGAAQRLQSTGFFRSVQFRYETAPDRKGYAVRFELTDDKDSLPARIDLPGIDENAVWDALSAADPLLTRQVPSNDIAQNRYIHAIETYAAQHGQAQKVAARVNNGALGSGHVTLVFEPENLVPIAAVRFTDTYALKPADVEAVLEPVAANSGYTETRFRQLLDLNVRPLYEEHGFLGVVFDRITLREDDSGRVTVTTHVIDGRAYTLGVVTLDGPGLPEAEMRQAAGFHIGERANWKAFLEGVEEMERVLKRQGYVHAQSRVERTLHSREGTVDAVVHVKPGPLYHFGRLELNGLPEDVKTTAQGMWTLRSGQPMNGEYPYEFLHDLLKQLRGTKGRVSTTIRPGNGENVLDVVIEFR
ncbi:MAG: POTRA domain-containing protein [Bryobacteraceae bacterium]|jgi:outer membrane protein assembly factor BamA